MNHQYEVLSPWADVDPVPLKGLTPRLQDLNGKTIGLFYNHKPASRFVQGAMERKLQEKYPSLKFSIYKRFQSDTPKVLVDEAEFKKWVEGVDAVVMAQGD